MQGEIVLACEADLERILQIYEIAKKYMHENREHQVRCIRECK